MTIMYFLLHKAFYLQELKNQAFKMLLNFTQA